MQRIVPFLLLSAAVAWGQSPLSGSKPNIVLILADDLSFRDLGIWGQDKFRTPHLDALAAAGVRFTQAYAGAPECAPSRGTLMTGLHVGHAPIRSNRSARGQDHLYPEDITLAETLKRAGYATGFFGKWGIGLPGTPGTPDKQGFDVAFGFYDQRRAHTFFPRYLYANAERIDYPGNDGFDMDHMYLDNRTKPEVRDTRKHYTADGALIPPGVADPAQAVYSQAVIEERALQFVRQRRSNPFFPLLRNAIAARTADRRQSRRLQPARRFPDRRSQGVGGDGRAARRLRRPTGRAAQATRPLRRHPDRLRFRQRLLHVRLHGAGETLPRTGRTTRFSVTKARSGAANSRCWKAAFAFRSSCTSRKKSPPRSPAFPCG